VLKSIRCTSVCTANDKLRKSQKRYEKHRVGVGGAIALVYLKLEFTYRLCRF